MSAPQGANEWRLERVGLVTASRISDVLATTKTGWGASRATYANELFAERMTGLPAERRFDTPEMKWGRDTEAQARAVYVFERDVDVQEVGLIRHPFVAGSGASPDGLIGDDETGGVLEIKCMSTSHHLEILESKKIPGRYVQQMYWQGACTQRRWGHFVCFDPRLEEPLQLFVQRVDFDPEITGNMEKEVAKFVAEIDERVQRMKTLNRRGVAA